MSYDDIDSPVESAEEVLEIDGVLEDEISLDDEEDDDLSLDDDEEDEFFKLSQDE